MFAQRALWFAEWRQQRRRITLAAVVVLALPCAQLLYLLLQFYQHDQVNVQANLSALRSTIQYGLLKSPPLGEILGLLAVLMGAQAFGTDRGRGDLVYALIGPNRRADVLRTKFFVGWAALMVIQLAFSVLLLGEDLVFQVHGPVVMIAAWFVTQSLIMTSMYSVTFALSTIIGNFFLIVLAAYGALSAPMFVAAFVQIATNGQFGYQLADNLVYLSPVLGAQAFYHSQAVWLSVVWFIAVSVVARKLSQYWFINIPPERYAQLFFLPQLWHWVRTLACVFLATFGGAVFTSKGAQFLPYFFIFLIFAWILSGLVFRRIQRYAAVDDGDADGNRLTTNNI